MMTQVGTNCPMLPLSVHFLQKLKVRGGAIFHLVTSSLSILTDSPAVSLFLQKAAKLSNFNPPPSALLEILITYLLRGLKI
jgi:hypothetical protein